MLVDLPTRSSQNKQFRFVIIQASENLRALRSTTVVTLNVRKKRGKRSRCTRYPCKKSSFNTAYQRWSRGHKARGQGQGHKKNPRPRPRTALPRTQKKSEAKDRNARGQGQECSRPRPRTKDTGASVLQKKKSSKIFFRRSPIRWRTQNLLG